MPKYIKPISSSILRDSQVDFGDWWKIWKNYWESCRCGSGGLCRLLCRTGSSGHPYPWFGGVDVMDNNIERYSSYGEGLLTTGVVSCRLRDIILRATLGWAENIGARYQEASGAKIPWSLLWRALLHWKVQGAEASYMKDPHGWISCWQKAANTAK